MKLILFCFLLLKVNLFSFGFDLLNENFTTKEGYKGLIQDLQNQLKQLQIPIKDESKLEYLSYSKSQMIVCSYAYLVVDYQEPWPGGPYPSKLRTQEVIKILLPSFFNQLKDRLQTDQSLRQFYQEFLQGKSFQEFLKNMAASPPLDSNQVQDLALLLFAKLQGIMMQKTIQASLHTIDLNFAVESFFPEKLLSLKGKFVDEGHPAPLSDLAKKSYQVSLGCIETKPGTMWKSQSPISFTSNQIQFLAYQIHPFDLPQNQNQLTARLNQSFHMQEKLLSERNNYLKKLSQEAKEFTRDDSIFLNEKDFE